jgi:hypothetical protein
MYLELSKPEYALDSLPTLTILTVKNDDGTVVQTCTATAARLDSTIMFLSQQFPVVGIVDKRFK